MRQRLIVVVVLLLLLLPVAGWATDWYCAATGTNGDGTEANPWVGFSNIVWGAGGVQAGDTLWIVGTHTGEQLTIGCDDVTIRGDYPGNQGVIDGDSSVDQCIYSSNRSGIIIKSLEIKGANNHGIHLRNADNSEVLDCVIHDNGNRGINIQAGTSNLKIANCQIYNNGTSGTYSYGIVAQGASDNITIKNCNIYNNGNFTNTFGSGIYFSSGVNNCTIEDCQIYSNGDDSYDGSGVEILDADHISIIRCKIWDSHDGIEARGNNSSSYPNSSDYLSIEYCLIRDVYSGVIYGEYPLTGGQETEYGKFYNNTLYINSAGFRIYSPHQDFENNIIYVTDQGSNHTNGFYFSNMTNAEIDSCTIDYNVVYLAGTNSHYATADPSDGTFTRYNTLDAWRADHSGLSAHDMISDPLLTPAYHLSAGSPCIDAGIKVAGVHFGDYWKDLDGNSDPWGSAPDIGCYEYNTGEVGWTPGWFVRPSGGNYGDEDGTSYENAWNGFANIVWGAGGVQAGDTLWLDGNATYTGQYFSIGTSGTAGSYVTINGSYGGGRAKIDANNAVSHAIRIDGKSYVILKNMEITGGTSDGIGYGGNNCDHLILSNLDIHDNLNGIVIAATNSAVSNCSIHDNARSGARFIADSSGTHIANCSFWGNGRTGDYNDDGLFVTGESIVVERCDAYNNDSNSGSGFDCSASAASHINVVFRHCKAWNNTGRGFSVSGDDKSADSAEISYCLAYDNGYNFLAYEKADVTIINNTFGDATYRSVRLSFDSTDDDLAVAFKNNIIHGNYLYAISTNTTYVTLDSDYNSMDGGTTAFARIDGADYSFDDWQSITGQDDHSINQNPLLTPNHHLSHNSPCINAGTTISGFHETALDIDKQPILGTPDIGCDERKALWWDGRRWHMQRMY